MKGIQGDLTSGPLVYQVRVALIQRSTAKSYRIPRHTKWEHYRTVLARELSNLDSKYNPVAKLEEAVELVG